MHLRSQDRLGSPVTAGCRKAFPVHAHGECKNRLFVELGDGFPGVLALPRANDATHSASDSSAFSAELTHLEPTITSGRPFRAYLYLSAIISEAPHCAHFGVYRGEQALLTKHIRRGVYSAPRALAQWP